MLSLLKRLGLFGLGMLAIAPSALAIPYGSNTVYKAVSGGKTYIYVSSTAGAITEVTLKGVTKTSVKTADACGQITVANSSTAPLSGTVTIGSTNINYDTLSTQLKPSCVNGTLSEARSTAYKTPEGALIGVGFTASAPQNVSLKVNAVRKVTANACGFAKFTGTATAPLAADSQFMIGSTTYTVSSVPDSTIGPRCNTIDGVARGFKPVGVGSW